MVTSKDILEQTGIKNSKTLTRWYKRGLIPKPVIRTHPSGRGKIAYWPDWVLKRCIRIAELRKAGHSLETALTMTVLERTVHPMEYLVAQIPTSDYLENKHVMIKDGRENIFRKVILALILEEAKRLIGDQDFLNAVASKMSKQNIVDQALNFLRSGYNPVLLFDGIDLIITTDFLVSHHFSYGATKRKPCLAVPLLPSIRKAYKLIGQELPCKPNTYPSHKIWTKQGDEAIEYEFYPTGPTGFELTRETAKIIGTVPTKKGKGDEARKP